jgi:outer membrane protein assembly factor BamB
MVRKGLPAVLVVFAGAACSAGPAEKFENAAAPLAPASADDWPGFLGPNGDGKSPQTGLLKTLPAGGPPVLWKIDVGEGYSAPTVARGVLVLLHRIGDREVVDGRDPATGKAFWRFEYAAAYRPQYGDESGPRCTPVVAGDRVFTLGPMGELHCLDLATGRLVWKRNLQTDFRCGESFFGFGSTPVVEAGKLLINIGGVGGAGIVALNTADGKTVWTATNDGASYSTPLCTTVGGTRHAFFFTRNGAVCLDPASGKVRWSVPLRARIAASVNAATPVVAGDLVFYTASYGTGGLLLRLTDGKPVEVRRDAAMACQFATPIHLDGHLYGFDDRFDGPASNLRCVELATGKVLWKNDNLQRGGMIYADGRLWILAEGKLVLVEPSPQAYREHGSVSLLGGRNWTAPVSANGRLFLRDEKTLMCLDVRERR